MTEPLRVGKVPYERLSELLARYGPKSRRVLIGPALGEDAAAVLTSQPCLVAATDPVTFASDRIGWYVVHVNANDIATRGADPTWFLFTLLLPEGKATQAMLEDIFAQVHAACTEVGAELVGGHTEVTAGIDRPIAVGTMLGETTTFRLTYTRGAQVGDSILLVNPLAVEGTALLARERPELLLARGLSADEVARAAELLDDPGISVLPAARHARIARAHAMHDPTEGGLTSALHEVADAAGVGLEIFTDQVLMLKETRLVCEALGLDPWGLLASGSLLVCCNSEDSDGLVRRYLEAGQSAARIAKVVPVDQGVRREAEDGRLVPLARITRDEVVRALAMPV